MATSFKVAVLVGSLRKESFTRKVANAIAAVAPPSLEFSHVDIGSLPLYNQDLDTDSPPAAWSAFRDAVRPADALLFATPEYNRSVPGVLKNAIDVGSRPYGKSVFDRKPGAVVSVSPGAIGVVTAPIIICASRWCSSTCRPCSSRKPMSAARTSCSTPPAT